MKNDELLRRGKMLPHNSVKSRSKFTPPKGNNGLEFNPLALVFLLCLPLCLTGCMGIYEGGFECPPGTGVGCKSISEVNSMVDRGEVPKIQVEPPTPISYEIWYAPHFRVQESESGKKETGKSLIKGGSIN